MSKPIVVLKFGSSVLRSAADLPAAVLEIYREIQQDFRVVAVVSAFGETTDDLVCLARSRTDRPDPRSLARLLETGEALAAAHLGLALAEVGLAAEVLDAVQIGLKTTGDTLDAEPAALAADRLQSLLDDVSVVVVPGFCGRDAQGRTTLLGRGGSDLTALYLARELGARECRLLKDVDGLLRVLPDGELDYATRYASAHYDECLRVGGPLIQPKAVEFAARTGQQFTIARCGSHGGTQAGPLPSCFESIPPTRPLRVALAGLGSVGLGVYRWLRALPEDFELTGVLVRNRRLDRATDVAAGLLTDSWRELLCTDPELLIEVMGGTDTAANLISEARRRQIPVVTANKELLAHNPTWLETDDRVAVPGVRASASVGGSLPALEHAKLLRTGRPIRSCRGILNGTCNFVLDRLQAGDSYPQAIAEAQAKGFAEADPILDVGGFDSVYKLSLLAAILFGDELRLEDIDRQGLDGVSAEDLVTARAQGHTLKLIAEVDRRRGVTKGRVAVVALPPDDPLASVGDEQNSLILTAEDGTRHQISGKGAGRYPTTCSVLADALAFRRDIVGRTRVGLNNGKKQSGLWRGTAIA